METRFRSHIASKLMTRTLWRGTALAVVGVAILVVFGSQMPPTQLKVWGFPLLIVAILFVAVGLVPYRRLSRLRGKPDEIILDDSSLNYLRRGEPQFRLSYSNVDRVAYVERRGIYGLGIWINQPTEFEQLEKLSRKRFGCDLFCPFFEEKECSLITDQLEARRAASVDRQDADRSREPAAP